MTGPLQRPLGFAVARKDFKVLIVDTSSVRPTSGANGISAAGISETIAAVIMGCWAGD